MPHSENGDDYFSHYLADRELISDPGRWTSCSIINNSQGDRSGQSPVLLTLGKNRVSETEFILIMASRTMDIFNHSLHDPSIWHACRSSLAKP